MCAAVLCSCTSSVSLDIDGGLRFPCTPTSQTERSKGGCPGNLFCGGDSACHSPEETGSYACRADFDCGGDFRCGPKGVCIDPSGDALRADAPDVSIDAGRLVTSNAPWNTVKALAVGSTFYERRGAGLLIDVSPVAVSDDTHVYVVATSQQGLLGAQPPRRFFMGRAPLAGVTELAVARNQVYALAGGKVYFFEWSPSPDGGALQELDAGAPYRTAIGTRLSVGSAANPFVIEYTPNADAGDYRVYDTSFEYPTTNVINVGGFNFGSFSLDHITDTDGRYVYAVVNGRVWAAHRIGGMLSGSSGPSGWLFSSIGLNSPGRDQLFQCNGTNETGEDLVFRTLHIGENPDLSQTEHPLVAVQVDAILDGGAVTQRWMRLDPDSTLGGCGSGFPQIDRHVVRGNCPTCAPGEVLLDLQWGVDPVTRVAALRSECAGPGGMKAFYDLQTDPGGFACYRTRRAGVGYRGQGEPLRARTNPGKSAVAFGKNVAVRRDGLDLWVPLALDALPSVAASYGPSFVAFGQRTMFVETPLIGPALHQLVDPVSPYPAWISGSWLFYDDGRVGPVTNLTRPPSEARFFATPAREDLRPPVLGTSMRGSDGRTYVVMSANDAVLGGEIADDTGTGAPKQLDVKVVPEPQVEVLSFTLLDAPRTDAGVLFEGFVLTENRVFALTAESEQRWTVRALDVIDGEWREVWADHDRGRLGYADGRVYALPSGVQIGSALSGGATDFHQFCGRSWALNETGLYRLDVNPDGGTGVWVEQGGVLPPGPRWQKMYGAADGDLWLLALDGTAKQVRGAPCTQ